MLEAAVAITSGITAGSLALVSFGLDSVIEVVAASALTWRLTRQLRGDAAAEQAERSALRIVGITFFALAAYIIWEAGLVLWRRATPQERPIGIGLALLSLAIMPMLAVAKRRVAARIHSRALAADAMETLICAYLSAVLLAGLGLYKLFGWWWVDSVAALAMLPLIVTEGWEACFDRDARCGSGGR